MPQLCAFNTVVRRLWHGLIQMNVFHTAVLPATSEHKASMFFLGKAAGATLLYACSWSCTSSLENVNFKSVFFLEQMVF